jgi:hypothetical protein
MRVAAMGEPIMILPTLRDHRGCVDGPGAVVCGESVSQPGAGLDRLVCRPRAQSRPGTYAGVPLSRGQWSPGANDLGGARL